MKRAFYIVAVILCPLFALSKGFTLKGSIEGLASGTITLDYVNDAGEDTSISQSFTGGTFTFAGKVSEPELVRLTVTGDWSYNITFYLENSDINIHIVKDAPQKTVISGSRSELVYERLKPGLIDFFEHARQNESAHHQFATKYNNRAVQTADSLWSVQQHEWIDSIRCVILSNKENYAALYFIKWLLFKPDNFDTIRSVFMQLSPIVRQGIEGKKFFADFERLFRVSPGQPAPEINGKDTSGQSLTLAALKGKVVLLDFWASYCGPCRQENRAMIGLYQRYHAQGFEIISFSLDNERSLWSRAIQADGLLWPQASELRGGASATASVYEVTDLPRNVLIDRTGVICAKDLHGDELIEALERVLEKDK